MKTIRSVIRASAATLTAAVVVGAIPAVAQASPVHEDAAIRQQLEELFTPRWGNTFLAEAVYRDVTTRRGWAPGTIEANLPFVMAVINRETGGSFCHNLRGGDRVDENCNILLNRRGVPFHVGSGHPSDAGYGQTNGVHYRNNGWMCQQEGLCSADDIIATPQTSMTALVAVFERGGSQPWCFNRQSRRSALCKMVVVRP